MGLFYKYFLSLVIFIYYRFSYFSLFSFVLNLRIELSFYKILTAKMDGDILGDYHERINERLWIREMMKKNKDKIATNRKCWGSL